MTWGGGLYHLYFHCKKNCNTNMEKILSFFILICLCSCNSSRKTENPTISKRPTSNCLVIESIDCYKDSTVIKGTYKNDGSISAWFSPETFIRDCNTRYIYTIIKSTGFPLWPAEYEFKSDDEQLNVTMTFPPIPDSVKLIDLIDEEDNELGFNFYGIELL